MQQGLHLIPLMVYDENHDIVHDPKIVIDHWQQDFNKLYNNFALEIQEKNNFSNQIKSENEIRELQITDLVYTSNRNLNRNMCIKQITKKSLGVDLMPNEVLKNEVTINILTHLFQLCLDVGKIPSIWKKQ